MFKKTVSVLLVLVMALGLFSTVAFAKTSEEVDTHLQYNENGKFTVMQISDIQDAYPMSMATKALLKKVLSTCSADLIVLTGDNISSSSLVTGYAALAINEFMSLFEKYGIPVVITFGNHDDEDTLATKEKQLKIYEQYDCFIGCAGEDLGDTNLCTMYVPIYSSKDANDMVSNIWVIDSGTYNTETESGGYAATTKAQIEWYKNKSAELEAKYGRKIPSLMFQHIIVPEIWDALEVAYSPETDNGTTDTSALTGGVWHNGSYYVLPEGTVGTLGEGPCPPNYNNGQFDALVERGDVMAMFFGHDHTNTFELTYKGIGLINTAGVGFHSYNSEDVGVRLIELDENDPWSFKTEMVSYFDLFGTDDEAAQYLFDSDSSTTDDWTHFVSFFKFIFAYLKQTIESIFSF